MSREQQPFDPTQPLVATGNLRRRHLVSRVAQGLAIAAAAAAVAVLVIVIWAVVSHGIKAISWDFITKGEPDGIAPDLVGTGIIVGIGTLIAAPIGVLIALFLSEYAGRRGSRAVQLLMDVMNGLPSIIIAVFIYILIVAPTHKQSGLAAAIALSIIEVPLIARGTQEVLNLVPAAQREAADALGVARWRSILTIILPSALGGIVTATLLSVARAAGETAPVLLISSIFSGDTLQFNPLQPLPNVPVRIFQLSEEANPEGFTEAWGLSLVLIVIILVLGLGSRALLNRSKRKLTR
ncbi:MAG: phosphate ABC transporter, permease protein PstA [Solirubrobacterales bacterium 70-9]|nr:MAG: phosphate ABC transporter, permease protein PstA [Solirubrobacterales bacterium 70-9]